MDVNKPLTARLTSTYDQCFDDCKVAIALEEKDEIAAADRLWNTVVEKIRSFRRRVPPSHAFQTETGQDAIKGLHELELTAQEHLDLHEGLRLSLQSFTIAESSSSLPAPSPVCEDDSSKCLDPPPLPLRPSLPPRRISSPARAAVLNGRSSSDSSRSQPYLDAAASSSSVPILASPSSDRRADRSASPATHKFRKTLRTGKPGFRLRDAVPTAPGADKAAAAAWIARDSRLTERVPSVGEASSSVLPPAPRAPNPAPEQSSLRYDRHTRRLVPRDNARSGDPLPPLSPSAATAASRKVTNTSGKIEVPGSRDRPPGARHNRSSSSDSPTRRRHQPNRGVEAAPDAGSPRARPSRRPVGSLRPQDPENRRSIDRTLSGDSRHERLLRHEPLTAEVAANDGAQDPIDSWDSKDSPPLEHEDNENTLEETALSAWATRREWVLQNLPPGVEKHTATQILDEIDPRKDVVHWGSIAGLEEAKNALKEAVVYPFLRPDLFRGLREPPKGILLFGPPGTGKTMLARAIATESQSTFVAITASTLNSKYLGESEKHVRALFTVARLLAPSIIFIDEVDSVLSQRSSSSEHEASRRLKTEFLIQWSNLEKSTIGKTNGQSDNRVLVLAATNRPWDLDDAATRRFARRQYIPLPEAETRGVQLRTLLESELKHCLSYTDIEELVGLTDGYSGSDLTHLARQASYGPLRSHGEAVLHMTPDEIRPIDMSDFVACLKTVRPSVNQDSLKQFEDWAKQFGERIG
ncbi:hypothetical protein RB598_003323 [Gaeumannomyces tritici]